MYQIYSLQILAVGIIFEPKENTNKKSLYSVNIYEVTRDL